MAAAPISIPAGIGTGNFIVREANGYRSRDAITIVSGAGKLLPGTILGKITATGKFTGFAPAANDGSETAAAILLEDVDATSEDVKRTIIARDCEVQRAMLVFVGTPTTNQKNAAYASLAALGIVLR